MTLADTCSKMFISDFAMLTMIVFIKLDLFQFVELICNQMFLFLYKNRSYSNAYESVRK